MGNSGCVSATHDEHTCLLYKKLSLIKSQGIVCPGLPEVGSNGCHQCLLQRLFSCRFLVFSELGRSLQSVLSDGLHLLREKAAFQIAIRVVCGEPVLPKRFLQKRLLTSFWISQRCFKPAPGAGVGSLSRIFQAYCKF